MAPTVERRTPVHLWIVGILALLWNGYGCYDYVMTTTGDEAFLSQFPAEWVAYWQGLPAWTTGAWALGVWGGLIGAVLLLMRSRYSVWAFALSLLGAVVGLGYQMFAAEMPAGMTEGVMAAIPWVIILIAVFLLWYSWSMDKKGVLR